MLKALNNFISLFLDTFKLFGRLKAWMLLLCIVLVNWLLLYSHYQFTDPMFYGFVTWWTEFRDSQYAGGFTHYPGHFILLSYYYNEARFFLSLLIEGGILGAVSVVFYRYIFSESDSSNYSKKGSLINWMHLTLAWSFINCILLAGYKYLPIMLSSFLWSSPRRQMMFDYALIPFFNIMVIALFFFAIPYIAIYRTNVLVGLKKSLLFFFKRPIFTFILSSAILGGPILISLILNNPAEIVDKFKPVMIYWALFIGIIIDLFVNFFWMGTAVNFLTDEE